MMHCKIAVLALLVVGLSWLPVLAADPKHEVALTLERFSAALAGNDAKAIVASCAPDAIVIDEFPPFAWSENGCAGWWTALQALVKKDGIKDLHVAASPPSLIYVEGPLAYAVMRARVTSVHDAGVRVWESLYATIVLRRVAGGWEIVHLAWTTAAQGSGK
jgi:ketosteroid isomerase-like protein